MDDSGDSVLMSMDQKNLEKPRILIVSSCGGHLTEIRTLRSVYEPFGVAYVLNDRAILSADMEGRTYFITHAERNWQTLVNFIEAYSLLQRLRPRCLLSTGAGPIVPFAIVGRVLFGTRVIFLETMTRVHRPSLTGRIMYWLAHDFFYQWDSLARYFPKGRCVGPIL